MRIRLKIDAFDGKVLRGEIAALLFDIPFSVYSDEKGVRFQSNILSFYVKPKNKKTNIFRILGVISLNKFFMMFSSENLINANENNGLYSATIMKIDLIQNKIDCYALSEQESELKYSGLVSNRLNLYLDAEISLAGIIFSKR